MTDERDKSRNGSDSRARPTARDVPFTRTASDAEPAPRAKRPSQLPRDPTYESELAKVELAVLRDRDRDWERRSDPSTKQGGRGHELVSSQPPESVTPESPGTSASRPPRSVDGPSSSGRAVASGTLLSIGAVDPRGRTEPTLETPRMFFSQPEGGEVYFKPGKIPAVTVHQTLETETVKLADSIDPRRAKTLPRIDRAALARFSEAEAAAESEAPVAVSRPPAANDEGEGEDDERAPAAWRSVDYDPASPLASDDASDAGGQIHASLSPFRAQAEPSFAFNEVPTRPEPLAARREGEPVVSSLPAPDTSAMPTQRDLPQHRIEASRPPPAPPPSLGLAPGPNSAPASSEAPSPTTASIAVADPAKRAAWTNYVAFVLALALAVVIGLWLTRTTTADSSLPDLEPPPRADVERVERPVPAPPAPPTTAAPVRALPEVAPPTGPSPIAPAPARPFPKTVSPAPTLQSPAPSPLSSPPPRKSSPPKPVRETIF